MRYYVELLLMFYLIKCFFQSDGKTCDVDECAYDNGGCSDDCANTIGSYVCLCPPGQEIVNDGKTCDQNECAVGNGGCSGDCVNTLGGFHCLCDNEFQVVSIFFYIYMIFINYPLFLRFKEIIW